MEGVTEKDLGPHVELCLLDHSAPPGNGSTLLANELLHEF